MAVLALALFLTYLALGFGLRAGASASNRRLRLSRAQRAPGFGLRVGQRPVFVAVITGVSAPPEGAEDAMRGKPRGSRHRQRQT